MDNTKKIKKILLIVLALNFLVAILKIIFGYWIRSVSMIADGYHSFSDGGANIIRLAGISIASRPWDESHPYGHKKYETFSSLLIAMMLFIIAYHIIHDGIGRLSNPNSVRAGAYSFAVMIFTMAVNVIVVAYEQTMGKRLKSDILIADSLHSRSDILTSLAVVASLIAVRAGYPVFDPICSLIISMFIAYAGFKILFSGSKVLCDAAIVRAGEIESIVKAVEGVTECHKIRTRGRQDDIHIDLHVLVRPSMHINQAEKLSDKIEEAIKAKIDGVSDVVVHMEPKGS